MTFDMFSRLDSGRGSNIGPRTVTRDEVMLPVRKLRGLRDLFVCLSERNIRLYAAEELRLERLAKGEGHHGGTGSPGSR